MEADAAELRARFDIVQEELLLVRQSESASLETVLDSERTCGVDDARDTALHGPTGEQGFDRLRPTLERGGFDELGVL